MIELIVLTAILAILAGVGASAYIGYTNAANKAADKQTVGDILHAAQVGSHTHDLTAPVQVPGGANRKQSMALQTDIRSAQAFLLICPLFSQMGLSRMAGHMKR
ncbi:MAG: type II secretion system GspH family protein [Lachnospiraceae bacterium]|nr:type II secretion system GspH family protein [Lachnospiraceae bacterium]